MTHIALKVHHLSKRFHVPAVQGHADPRRESCSRRWDWLWALRDVTFEIPRSQTVGLIGPNGSGKSTLLKILSGVSHGDGGGFEAHGRIGALLELGAGFHPDLTGIENVYLNGSLLGLSSLEVDRLLPDIIGFAELERFMDMPVRHYSSGMTARLGFATATRLAPDILLMDETFAAGDARFQARALDHIAQMKAAGHTLILVSHNAEIILQLTDRVIWLDHGRLRRDGEPQSVVAEYQRTQQLGLEGVDAVRTRMGLAGLFDQRVQGEPPVTLAETTLHGPHDQTRELAIETGECVTLELTLRHPQPAPRRVAVETAWALEDETVVAQSRSQVELEPDQDSTRICLDFDNWTLQENRYRCAVAVGPVPDQETESATDFDATKPSHHPYYDAREDCGAVRVVTPNPFDLPALKAFSTEWEA